MTESIYNLFWDDPCIAYIAYMRLYNVKNYNHVCKQESPADAGIPARRKNDEKNSSISKL